MAILLMKLIPPFDINDDVDISSFFGSISSFRFSIQFFFQVDPKLFHTSVLLADVVSTFIQISINMLAQELAQVLVHSFTFRLFSSC